MNVTLILNEQAPITDSCSPTSPLTANHVYDCSDYCNVTSELNAAGYDILIIGEGTTTFTANIINPGNVEISGGSGICEVNCLAGKCFTWGIYKKYL